MNVIIYTINQKVDKDIADIIEYYLWKERFNITVNQIRTLKHNFVGICDKYGIRILKHYIRIENDIGLGYIGSRAFHNNSCYQSHVSKSTKLHTEEYKLSIIRTTFDIWDGKLVLPLARTFDLE